MSQLTKTLAELNKGAALADADAALAKVLAAVRETGRPGAITLRLKVEPSELAEHAVEITPEIATKEPRPKRGQSLFFVTEAGTLTRQDPNQPELPFKTIEGGRADDETQNRKEATA